MLLSLCSISYVSADDPAYQKGEGSQITAGNGANKTYGKHSVIVSGKTNTTGDEKDPNKGEDAAVLGGIDNVASAVNSTVVGGSENKVLANGNGYTIAGTNSSILGGRKNTIYSNGASYQYGKYATISGGSKNIAAGDDSTIAGGQQNRANGLRSAISGGFMGVANGKTSAIFGGSGNITGDSARLSTINGGAYNVTDQELSNIYGGKNNYIMSASNTAYGTIVGGELNTVKGNFAMAIGGTGSYVMGDHSVAIGGGKTGEKAKNSIAIGSGAYATVEEGIAIGKDSVASEAGTISFGHAADDKNLPTYVDEDSLDKRRGGKDTEFIDPEFKASEAEKYDKTLYKYTDEDIWNGKASYAEASYNRLVNIGYGKNDHEAAAIGQTFELKVTDSSSKYLSLEDDGKNDYNQAVKRLSINIGQVAKDSAGLVSGGDVYNFMKDLVIKQTDDKNIVFSLPEGEIKVDEGRAVSGGTVCNELRPKNDGTYVKNGSTTAENLTALDKQVKENKDINDRQDKDIDALKKQNQHTQELADGISSLSSDISRLDSRIDRVCAGAAALAALHPQDFDPDNKWDITAGYGHYRSADALALGVFYRPNEKNMISFGGSMGGGENMVNAGISLKLGKGNPYAGYSKTDLIQALLSQKDTITSLSSRNEELEAKVNAQEEQIDYILKQLASMK